MNAETNKKNILDLLHFDITGFFAYPHIEVATEDTPAIQIVDYEAKLEHKEFEIFDTIRLRVLFDKNNITGETHVNVTYKSKRRRTTKDDAKYLINFFAKIYNNDNNNKCEWSEADEIDFENNDLNRVWATGIGENFISIFFKEISGLELNILFANNLLKNTGKQIDF